MGGKTRSKAFQPVLAACCKTSQVARFLSRFTKALVEIIKRGGRALIYTSLVNESGGKYHQGTI